MFLIPYRCQITRIFFLRKTKIKVGQTYVKGTSLWEMSNRCFTIPMLLSPFIAPIHLSTPFLCYKKKKKYDFSGLVEGNDFLLYSYCNNIVYLYIFKLNDVGDFELKYEKLTSYNIFHTLI